MIIDVEESVNLDEEGNLADQLVGGMWGIFRNAIPPLQAKVLDNAFNLIMVSDQDVILPNQIADVLANDNIDLSVKKQAIYVLMAVNIMTLLTEMGLTLDDNVAGEDKIKEMSTILDFFLSLNEYEDLIGLKPLLECTDIPPVNRFLRAMEIFWGEDFDISEFECLVLDVSEVTLKSIRDTLFNPTEMVLPPDNIVKRVIENKELMEGTMAYQHVVDNGQVGGSMVTYINFFQKELETLLETDKLEDSLQYAKEIISLFLISEINNDWLKDKMTEYLYKMVTDIVAITKVEDMIDKVVIPS